MPCCSVPGTWTGTDTPGDMSPDRRRDRDSLLDGAVSNSHHFSKSFKFQSGITDRYNVCNHTDRCWSWPRTESADEGRSMLMSQSCVGQTGMEATCKSRRRPTGEE